VTAPISTTAQIDDLCFTPAVDLAAMLRSRELSPVELIQALLDRIERVNPVVNAFVTLRAEEALEEARAAERDFATRDVSELGALHGLPVNVKDLTPTAGVRTTFGHAAFKDYVPDEDGVIWARLKAAGAILLGKTATPAFGEHGITESEVHGVTNNPWDATRSVGGSSGGAAASVVSGMGPLSTGSDGGGSIRVPSALCGAVGLKASRGRIPFRGDGSPLETVVVVGPITRTVRDNALMLNVVAGPDPYEMFAIQETGTDYLAALEGASVAGLRVAYSPDLGSPVVAAEVREIVARAVAAFEDALGAHVDEIEIDLPDAVQYFKDWWSPQLVMGYEDLDAMGVDITPDPAHKPFIEYALNMNATEYARVQFDTRDRLHRAFADVFLDHDLLLFPTTPIVAFPHPGAAASDIDGPVLLSQTYTEAIAHAGYPAITVPAGWTEGGLPVGLQIAGPHAADAAVLRAAAAFEEARPWADRRPPL
jgi:Asp-tRNA(Asn)/Glu-tRNA(Gln) amidotransferase A subunit family amidase